MIKRYYDYEMPNGVKLKLEPPKLKTLRKLTALIKGQDEGELTEEQLDDLITILAMILSKNKSEKLITKEMVEDCFDIDDLYNFFNEYVVWVGEIQNEKN